jgi:Mn2+/Fe2+ NRAMP family transporter
VSAILDLILGVVTSIGGFVEAGSISTAAQAGSEFRYQLLWAIAAATIMLALLIEMSGRLAAVSKRSLAAAVRERFGVPFQSVPLAAELAIDILLLAAEIGGVGIALQLMTGVGFQWWILPAAGALWALLMFGGFSVIEYGLGLLGLVTLSFVYAAWHLAPPTSDLLHGFVPTAPGTHHVRYAYLAVSILGATVSPYLLNFYSSGTVEEKMTEDELWVNRTTAYLGMCFGGIVSMGVLVTSAIVLAPRHIIVDSYEQAALMFVPVFGRWAVTLFAASLGVGCFGAAVEIALNMGYLTAQVSGWSWGANRRRVDAARFTTAFTVVLIAAAALALTGFDPLKLTLLSVALTVVIMPLVVLPFLVLMNDETLMATHKSGPIGNTCLAVITILAAIFAVVVIPLEILGGS